MSTAVVKNSQRESVLDAIPVYFSSGSLRILQICIYASTIILIMNRILVESEC